MRAALAARAHPLGTRGLPLLCVGLAAFALQQGAIRLLPADDGFDLVRQALFVATTLAVLFVAWRLRTLLGAWLLAAGIGLNCLPMLAHGGNMPVAWETVSASGAFPEITEGMLGSQITDSKDVLLMRDDIRFEWLSDRFFIDPPIYRPNIYSFGDFVIFAGVAVAAFELALWVAGVDVSRHFQRRRNRLRPALE
jgi:hypothetical protein